MENYNYVTVESQNSTQADCWRIYTTSTMYILTPMLNHVFMGYMTYSPTLTAVTDGILKECLGNWGSTEHILVTHHLMINATWMKFIKKKAIKDPIGIILFQQEAVHLHHISSAWVFSGQGAYSALKQTMNAAFHHFAKSTQGSPAGW